MTRVFLAWLSLVCTIMFVIAPTAMAACGPNDVACAAKPALHLRVGQSFLRGARAVGHTVVEWVGWIGMRLGLIPTRAAALGDACDEKHLCTEGLACMNVCEDHTCDKLQKRCVQGPSRVSLVQAFAPCNDNDLCANGTVCARTCSGRTCLVQHRCIPETAFRSECADLPAPPPGTAWKGSCITERPTPESTGADQFCTCRLIEIEEDAVRVACPNGMADGLVCPPNTFAACTPSDCGPLGAPCPPMPTCLKTPAAGGTCLEDRECAAANCGGAQPFCGSGRCRCRTTVETTVACNSPADCGAITCVTGQQTACVNNLCGCAALPTDACERAEDCRADCPSGYEAACASDRCVCQRTKQNTPLSCASANDCGGVSCPQGYDKTCREGVCACVRLLAP